MKKVLWVSLLVWMMLSAKPMDADALIVINEILADPAVGTAGDANHDGVTSSNDDEFLELFNYGDGAIDLSGWSIADAIATRHVFAVNTVLTPYAYLAIFGGGNPQLPGINWQKASTGSLSLNNTGDTVTLFNSQAVIIDQVIYGSLANHDQSMTRFPEGTGKNFVLHSSLTQANGKLFSPGTSVSGGPISPSLPEIPPIISLMLGVSMLLLKVKSVRN